MGKFIDLTGQRFEKIVVIERTESKRRPNGCLVTRWLCKCDCGNIKIYEANDIKRGLVKHCGCLKNHNLIGKKFNRWTVIERASNGNANQIRWLCKCDCGNTKIVIEQSLKNGRSKSCGCFLKEEARKRCFESKRFLKHGLSKDKKYARIMNIYQGMKDRCYKPTKSNYLYYGGRGIKICEEWLDKENGLMKFYIWAINNGYEDNLTIERIDKNGNYSPDNCKWATFEEQANNKRNNHLITYNGETHTIAEWSKILNIPYCTLFDRLKRKYDIKKVFNKSIGHNCAVLQYSLNGNFIKKYNSIKLAKQETGAKDISECCKGKFKQSGGYIWRYANEIDD